jgi:hypothetical protein
MRTVLLLAALAITPLLLSEDASAQCASGYGYGAYRAPVVGYGPALHHHHQGHQMSPYYSPYRRGYGAHYGSPNRYGSRRGGYGYGSPYNRRGTAIGIRSGGVSLGFAF